MKIYGYVKGDEDLTNLSELQEVTLELDVPTLRSLVKFLSHTIEEMERRGDEFGHRHFSSFDKLMTDQPEFIITRPHD
jgi:hypothetical protein